MMNPANSDKQNAQLIGSLALLYGVPAVVGWRMAGPLGAIVALPIAYFGGLVLLGGPTGGGLLNELRDRR